MNTERYLVLAATLLFAGNIIHAADAPEAQPRPAAEAKKKPAGPKPLTPEQHALHLPFLPPDAPKLAADDLVHQTVDGTVVIEAEHFTAQQRDQIRRWYLNSAKHTPAAKPDGDPVNVDGAGGGAYMEALPDTFVVEGDRAIDGINLGLHPGSVAVLCYKVGFSEPGRYYLWTRMRSDDEEDNTLNAGLNDEWPASAKCLQFQKHTKAWQWGGVIRAPQGPSFPRLPAWLDVPAAGVHTVLYSMREDGCCFDRFILTMNKEFARPEGVGPASTSPKAGKLPEPIAMIRTDKPLVKKDVVFEETDGQLVVDAEAFFSQTNTEKRAWHITSAALTPKVGRDIDVPHFADASGGAYIEVLPDTGNDPVGPVAGESISDVGGAMAVASYHVHFNNPGRYYIWVRALGTDGDDNTLHFGMDGEWPTNSAKMHHNGGGKWDWACRHRQHKGKLWLDVTKAGPHVIHLSMREDGCEVDRFILTTNEDFVAPTNRGPVVKLKSGVLPDFSAAKSSANSGDAIVIEAESVSAEGWELATVKAGFSGTGYLRWTKSGQGRKAGEGVLSYSFRITTPGKYQFLWRTALPDPKNRPETPDPDGNDSWVRFTSGAEVPGQRALGNEWRKVALLGHPEGWSWSTHADQGPPHPATPVCRAFEPGEHRLEICGRSAGHALDQLVLHRFEVEPWKDTPGETLPAKPTALRTGAEK